MSIPLCGIIVVSVEIAPQLFGCSALKESYEENAHYIRCNNSTYNVLTKAHMAAIEESFAGLYQEGYNYFMLYDKCKNSI